MTETNFNKPPSEKDLKKYSKFEMQEKRNQLASWIKELRQMKRDDPEKAKDYIPPRQLISRFYEEVNQEYKALPFNKEEIEQKFSDENLSSITLAEYIELLKKVPSRFILHITRQGVRDRTSFHSGRGEVYHGFEGILSQRKIKSVLEQYLEGIIEKDSVRNLLENYLHIPEKYSTKEEAVARIRDFLTRHLGTNLASSEVADISATHASMDYVVEEFYGGEPGNEIFFLYPTAHIASQYNIASQWGTPASFNMKESGISSQYNDLWLKTKSKNKGELSVSSSIVFIPKNTLVDPNTGSRYKIEYNKPVENTDEIEKIKTLIQSPEFKDLWIQISSIFFEYQNLNWELSDINRRKMAVSGENEKSPFDHKIKELENLVKKAKESISKISTMAIKFNITDQRFFDILNNPTCREFDSLQNLLSLSQKENIFSKMTDWEVSDKFAQIGLSFKLADSDMVIESEKYWERYFQKTGNKPSKVIYYEETTPNQALESFKQKAGLFDNQHSHIDLKNMFSENVMETNKEMHLQMQEGIELIARYSEELLSEYYTTTG